MTEGSTGSTIAVGSAVPARLLPGSFALAPLLGSGLVAALVGAAIGDLKVAAGEGGVLLGWGSTAGVATGARAVAFCSTRGGSPTPRMSGVQLLPPQVAHIESISVTSGGNASWGFTNIIEAKSALIIRVEKQD